jgi:hypothetical protein
MNQILTQKWFLVQNIKDSSLNLTFIIVLSIMKIFFSDGNSNLEFGVHFYLDGNSFAGLKGLRPSPSIKYYTDGNSCAPFGISVS